MKLIHGHYYRNRRGDVIYLRINRHGFLYYIYQYTGHHGHHVSIGNDGKEIGIYPEAQYDLVEYVRPPRMQQLQQGLVNIVSYLGRAL